MVLLTISNVILYPTAKRHVHMPGDIQVDTPLKYFEDTWPPGQCWGVGEIYAHTTSRYQTLVGNHFEFSESNVGCVNVFDTRQITPFPTDVWTTMKRIEIIQRSKCLNIGKKKLA